MIYLYDKYDPEELYFVQYMSDVPYRFRDAKRYNSHVDVEYGDILGVDNEHFGRLIKLQSGREKLYIQVFPDDDTYEYFSDTMDDEDILEANELIDDDEDVDNG